MRTTRLLSTVAATLLLGAGAAAAQGMNGPVKPERAPAAQQTAPAEKIAPNMHAGERKPAETTGQGSAHALKPGAAGNAALNEHGTVGASPQKDEDSGAKSGMKAEEHGKAGMKADANGKAEGQAQENSKTGSNAAMRKNGNENNSKNAESGSSNRSASEQSSTKSKSETSGQGAAASSAKLTTEQRTKITTAIKQHKVQPAHLDISVHVGVHIPARVHYYPLPAEVVAVYPEWRGYDYILVGDQIVIIDPSSRAIVFIIET